MEDERRFGRMPSRAASDNEPSRGFYTLNAGIQGIQVWHELGLDPIILHLIAAFG